MPVELQSECVVGSPRVSRMTNTAASTRSFVSSEVVFTVDIS